MKKIFTLAAAMLLASGAFADNTFKTLDKNVVIYFTNDTITGYEGEVYDEEEGIMVPGWVEKSWMGQSCINAINNCGLPCSGMSTTVSSYWFKTTQDYVDAATGFTMKTGDYKGIFIDGTFSLNGALGDNKLVGYKNLKSVVLYLMPVPTAWTADGSISHQDYPTGRVAATYYNDEGTQVSNNAYRELHMDMTEDPLASDTRSIKGTLVCNFQRDAENPYACTVDRPYRLEVNLQNLKDAKEYEDIFESATKQSEFANLMAKPYTEGYESEMSYYFAKKEECSASYDANTAEASSPYYSASGYNCFTGKWGSPLTWSKDTPIQIQVKKRLYLVGMALVSANNTSESEFIQCSDGATATVQSSAIAYGSNVGGVSGIQNVNASASKVAPRKQLVNGQIVIGNYNIAGQRVK